MHSSLFDLDNEAACKKIVGSGFDFGKSSPLTLCEKYGFKPNLLKTRSIVPFDAEEAKISSISLVYKSLINCSTPEINSKSGLVSNASLNKYLFLNIKSFTSASIPKCCFIF